MRETLKKHESKLRFGLIGGLNTAIDFVILFLLNGVGLNKYVANLISTSVAFSFSFLLTDPLRFNQK